MSRIRMAVEIRNETADALTYDHEDVSHGDWTDPWQPPARIAPGATAEFRAEGNAVVGEPTTGTEGRVWYNVAGDPARQLYVHFDSPLIESQYGNTFHVWAPPEYEVGTTGGQGHDARLVVRLRGSARRRVRGFVPSVSGFQFSNNDWSHDLPVVTLGRIWNQLLDALAPDVADALGILRADDDWLPITRADQGMCGGMVFAAMDYANAHLLPPDVPRAPTSVDDPLFRHIRDRLLASFDVLGSGYRWLAYSSPHYPNGDEGFVQAVGLARGRSWISYRDEWPRIRDDIDGGRLAPIGLIQTDSLAIGDNHQVLGYAYQQHGQVVDLWVYDPNEPRRDDVVLHFDITDTAGEVHVTRFVDGRESPGSHRIFGFMKMDGYQQRQGPGGRPGDSIPVRQALLRETGRSWGTVPEDTRVPRPMTVRDWMRSF